MLFDESTGEVADAVVRRIGAPVTSPDGTVVAEVDLVGVQALPVEWSGREVRATFTSQVTAGPVLVVPLAAVTLADDGTERVQVLGPDGSVRVEFVRAGVSANGFVEVEPVTAGGLVEGDEVVTGIDAGPPVEAGPSASGPDDSDGEAP